MERLPRIIIVGGGFGGLAVAKALKRTKAEVTLLDRRNHHVFQPLLYQVATASLSPADISASIRSILRHQANCQVALVEANAIDVANKRVIANEGYAEYDYLILAAGATHAYFGHDEWASIAPGLKSLDDATKLRRQILLAFESAEFETSDQARQAALTFAIVGAGPTGVELAGAIKEIAGMTIPKDYKHIDTRTTRVIIFEGGDRILPQFTPDMSARAARDLKGMGVELRTKALVSNITHEGVYVGNDFIAAKNVFWAAGVKASPLGQSLGVPTDRSGRVIVGPDLTIPGHPEVFVIGDMAAAKSEDSGKPVPGVAQGGIQMGEFVGRMIADEISGKSTPAERRAFRYYDKGTMAIIGKAKAVAEIGKFHFGGFIAWLLWGGIHILFLIGFRNRISVMASWIWNWMLNARDARLITGEPHIPLNMSIFHRPEGGITQSPPATPPSQPAPAQTG